MTELSAGVRALIGRMESNPEEFYEDTHKWRFIYGDRFRDVMTEPEKGALHEGLKQARRKEFDQKVMRELLQDEMEEQIKGGYYTTAQLGGSSIMSSSGFGQAQIKAQGTAITVDEQVRALNAKTSLKAFE